MKVKWKIVRSTLVYWKPTFLPSSLHSPDFPCHGKSVSNCSFCNFRFQVWGIFLTLAFCHICTRIRIWIWNFHILLFKNKPENTLPWLSTLYELRYLSLSYIAVSFVVLSKLTLLTLVYATLTIPVLSYATKRYLNYLTLPLAILH